MHNKYNFDIIIIGGGIIGLTLACSLRNSNLSMAIIERRLPNTINEKISSRSLFSVINVASEKLFNKIGVWSEIISNDYNCFHNMKVWDKDNFGCINFNDTNIGYNLGYVVNNKIIHNILWNRVQYYNNIKIIGPIQNYNIIWNENDVSIVLDNKIIITSKLVIGADGMNSLLRSKANIPLVWWLYRHHALVAIVRTVDSHNNIARQIFCHDSILAFLPLSDINLCYIVWSLLPKKAKQMQKLEEKYFNRAICVAFDNCLGLCKLESERYIFPIIGSYSLNFAEHRLVLLGDAAHTIHPLAGQGLNLGLMDVAELTKDILLLHKEGRDIGQYIYLRQYERNSKYRAMTMIIGIHLINELFNDNKFIKRFLRAISLNILDILPSIKRKILLKAMGLYDLPNWLI